MKTLLKAMGVVMVLMGTIWFLQGANVLTAGRSFMIGDPVWEYYGVATAVLGLALLMASRNKISS
jgi:hypothetical protein